MAPAPQNNHKQNLVADTKKAASRQAVKNAKVKKKQTTERVREQGLSVAQWHDYNAHVDGSAELATFIREIESVAQFAETDGHLTQRLIQDVSSMSSHLDIIQHLVDYAAIGRRADLIQLRDGSDLQSRLRQPFTLPLFHRATDRQPSLVPAASALDLETLLSILARDPDAAINVYDYAITNAKNRTRRTTVKELLDRLQPPFSASPAQKTLNFLDIENRTGIQLCPPAIKLSDVSLVARDPVHDVGKRTVPKQRSSAADPEEFFVLSTKGAVSTIHIDTGGANTWVAVLSGRKIWYIPRFADEQALLQLAAAGSAAPLHYPHDWLKIELRAGDLLIMPPGLPHAVYTPEDCLLTGGQFYTPANLGRTLRTIRFQETYPGVSNENLDDSVYLELSEILDSSFERHFHQTSKLSVVANALGLQNPAAKELMKTTTGAQLQARLKHMGVGFSSKTTKPELVDLLLRHTRYQEVGKQHSPQDTFAVAVHSAVASAEMDGAT